MLKPTYAETIIVLVKYKKLYRWYVTDKEIWFLDLRKLIISYQENGFDIPNPDDFSERFNIAVVNEDTAEEFLQNIREYQVSTKELSDILVQKGYQYITDMMPSLSVNFDEKKLISYYPEPASYERYVPIGWLGEYEEFAKDIPEEYQFWLIEGKDLLFSL